MPHHRHDVYSAAAWSDSIILTLTFLYRLTLKLSNPVIITIRTVSDVVSLLTISSSSLPASVHSVGRISLGACMQSNVLCSTD